MAITRVKICGLTRKQDVEAALDWGADAVGFVMESSSMRYVDEAKAKGLMKDLPPYVTRVGVFGTMYPSTDTVFCDIVQSVKWALPSEIKSRKIQVIRVKPDIDIMAIMRVMRDFDAFLLDAAHDTLYGGTGKKVDWNLASELVKTIPKPVILAGGLTPDNVSEAIRMVRPFAVDVSSGVESSPGLKDPAKIKDFIQAAKGTHVS